MPAISTESVPGHPALSLAYHTIPELDLLETIDLAGALGLAHIGLRLLSGRPDEPGLAALTDATLRRTARSRLRDAGLSILDANTARLAAGTDVADFTPFLDVAAEMGARHVLATAETPDRGRLLDQLAALCDMASGHGLTVEFEFVPWMAVRTLADANRLLDEVAHPALGIAVDALHLHRSAGGSAEVAQTARERLRYWHICDAPAAAPTTREGLIHEAVRDRLDPGEGELDLTGLLAAMPTTIPIAIEVPSAERALHIPTRERVTRTVAATRALLNRSGNVPSC